jgi:hypothetical protein
VAQYIEKKPVVAQYIEKKPKRCHAEIDNIPFSVKTATNYDGIKHIKVKIDLQIIILVNARK